VFALETTNVKSKPEQKNLRLKRAKFSRFWGLGGQRFEKVAIFTAKGRS